MLHGTHLQRCHGGVKPVNGTLNLGLAGIWPRQCARKIPIGCPHFGLIRGPVLGKGAFELGDLAFLINR